MWPSTSNDAGSSPTNYLQFSSVFFLLSAEESGAKKCAKIDGNSSQSRDN